MSLESDLNSQSDQSSSGGGWFDSLKDLAGFGVDAFKAQQATEAAKKNAAASKATATASILSTRNIIIAASIVALAIVAFVIFRRK